MYLLVNVTPLNWSGGFHLFLVNTELLCSFFSLPWVVEEDAKIQVYRWIGAGNRKRNRFINPLSRFENKHLHWNKCIKVIRWTLNLFVTLNKIPQSLSHNGGKFCGSLADLLTLKANWFDTLTVKQWEVMINNDVLLFSVTNEDTPYEQLLYYWICYSFTVKPRSTDTRLIWTPHYSDSLLCPWGKKAQTLSMAPTESVHVVLTGSDCNFLIIGPRCLVSQ